MFDPHEYLRLAKRIEASASSEAEYRNCVGRAYYAAYLVAREHAASRSIPLAAATGSHERVIRTVQRFQHPRARFYMNQLRKLKYLRTDADYKLPRHITDREARAALRDAEDLIQWIDQLP